MDVEKELEELRRRICPLEELIAALSQSLNPPILYDSGEQSFGFRYGKPDARHFCLLKSARAVSGLNACLYLARAGFTQELAVIIRTVIECATHIEYVLLSSRPDGSMELGPAHDHVHEFFRDYIRHSGKQAVGRGIKQKVVHSEVGGWLDSGSTRLDRDSDAQPAHELLSNIYITYSKYVHAKYPECMDMYGGAPGHFHLSGMAGTPKDHENLEILDTFTTAVSQTLAHIVRQFHLGFVKDDPLLASWMSPDNPH